MFIKNEKLQSFIVEIIQEHVDMKCSLNMSGVTSYKEDAEGNAHIGRRLYADGNMAVTRQLFSLSHMKYFDGELFLERSYYWAMDNRGNRSIQFIPALLGYWPKSRAYAGLKTLWEKGDESLVLPDYIPKGMKLPEFRDMFVGVEIPRKLVLKEFPILDYI